MGIEYTTFVAAEITSLTEPLVWHSIEGWESERPTRITGRLSIA